MTRSEHRAVERLPFDSLTNRLAELERERSAARDQLRVLASLQAAFTRIAVTRDPQEIIAHALRAARDSLGFSRAIHLEVGHATIEARWQIDGSDQVERSAEPIDDRPDGPLWRVAFGDATQAAGKCTELLTPLLDTRGWYVLSGLADAERTFGLLYVDGHPASEPCPWETGLVAALASITAVSIENGLLLERTQQLAMRDPLTGLLNRRAFQDRLLQEIEFCRRSGNSLALALVDVDDFKGVNDARGHVYGDSVLKAVAETLLASSRAEDVVGRFAGDEFVVLLVNADPHLARHMVHRLSDRLRASGLRCSLGAAIGSHSAGDGNELLKAADRALYAAKAAGKDGYAFA